MVYFQLKWVARDGPAVAFGCQGVVVAGSLLAVVATQIWGAKWRARFPAPAPEN